MSTWACSNIHAVIQLVAAKLSTTICFYDAHAIPAQVGNKSDLQEKTVWLCISFQSIQTIVHTR